MDRGRFLSQQLICSIKRSEYYTMSTWLRGPYAIDTPCSYAGSLLNCSLRSSNHLPPPISPVSYLNAFFVTYLAFVRSMLQFLVTANVVPSSLILSTLMMEALHSSEMSFLRSSTRRHIPEDRILHSHCSENLKSYIALTGWAL
jgi:hypothetical protein